MVTQTIELSKVYLQISGIFALDLQQSLDSLLVVPGEKDLTFQPTANDLGKITQIVFSSAVETWHNRGLFFVFQGQLGLLNQIGSAYKFYPKP